MKIFVCAFLFALVGNSIADKFTCVTNPHNNTGDWKDMVQPCIKSMRDQVHKEVQASANYLAMGAHFDRDTINRPGFSDFFYESAREEREHAIKFMEYLLMRGELTDELSNILETAWIPTDNAWESPLAALNYALKMETNVTRSIQAIMSQCENSGPAKFNDYHLVDYLTTEFMEEQYRGQRDLAGKISTLGKMMHSQGTLGEFLFDKKLLKRE